MTAVLRVLAVVLALVVSLAGCVVVERGPASTGTPPPSEAPPDGGEAAPPEQRMARAIFDRVNAEREARGLEPVVWSSQLAAVAREWSAQMHENGQMEHQDLREVLQGEELSGFVSLGENVFRSTGPVGAGRIHAGWMRSDGHRVNVVNPGWGRLGVGVLCAEDGTVWATQEFGRTAGSDRPSLEQQTPPQEPIVRPEPDGPTCG